MMRPVSEVTAVHMPGDNIPATALSFRHLFWLVVIMTALPLILPLLADQAAAADNPGPIITQGEFCITCNVPVKQYKCSVRAPLGASIKSLKYKCVIALAQKGHHAFCSVTKKRIGSCEGKRAYFTYLPSDGQDARQKALQEQNLIGQDAWSPEIAPAGPQQTKEEQYYRRQLEAMARDKKTHEAEPGTVLELTDKTVKSSQQGIAKIGSSVTQIMKKTGEGVTSTVKKAGEGVTSTVKKAGEGIKSGTEKSWNCLTSLFQKC